MQQIFISNLLYLLNFLALEKEKCELIYCIIVRKLNRTYKEINYLRNYSFTNKNSYETLHGETKKLNSIDFRNEFFIYSGLKLRFSL